MAANVHLADFLRPDRRRPPATDAERKEVTRMCDGFWRELGRWFATFF